MFCFFFFFKQKTAYEMRISDWSSDVCSSDLSTPDQWFTLAAELESTLGACELANEHLADKNLIITLGRQHGLLPQISYKDKSNNDLVAIVCEPATQARSEERRVGKECVSTCRSRGSRYH